MPYIPDFPPLEELQNKTAAFDITKTQEYHLQKTALIKEMKHAAGLGKSYLRFALYTVLPDLIYVFSAELSELGYSVEFDAHDLALTIKW